MKPHSFCETPKENCTMNHCDENGCLNRKRELVELMLKSSDHNPYTGMLSKKDNITMTHEQLEKFKDFLTTLECEGVDLAYFANENTDNADELREEIYNQGGFDIEVIYYSTAIEYLKNHDPSLRDSLDLAFEYGYEVNDINSETLASLLARENAILRYTELEKEITQFLETLI